MDFVCVLACFGFQTNENKQTDLNCWRVFARMLVFRVLCTLDCMNLRGCDLKIRQRLQREVSERDASCLSDSFAFLIRRLRNVANVT